MNDQSQIRVQKPETQNPKPETGPESDLHTRVQHYKEVHGARILRDFARWLSIPNVVGDREAIDKNAKYLQAALRLRGVHTEIWQSHAASPAVYGEWMVPGARKTILLYAHFDGQPANPEEWTVAPWEPTLFTKAIDQGGEPIPFPEPRQAIDPEWRVYARSASDDKAPFIAMLSALDILQENGLRPSVNLKFFFESDEEAGSPDLPQHLVAHADRLRADALFICDGPVHQSRRPQLYFGARGFTGFTMTVYGPQRHLHSGHYGNWAPNPAMMLAQLLASFKSPEGDVLIEGFYDDAIPLNAVEKEALETVPAMDALLRHELALARSECRNAPLNEQIMKPSLNLRGLKSGVADGRIVNMIPQKASASIDIRLVKGNTQEKMLETVERHIERQGFHIVREEPDRITRLSHPRIARIVHDPGYPPVRTDMSLPVIQSVIEAVRRSIGDDLVLLPTLGASLPLHHFDQHLGIPIVGVPIANHDNNQHGPDENLRVANLWYGIDLFTLLIMGIGAS